MKKPTGVTDEKTVLSLLDVLGSCLVDIFYNHMYDRAISVHEKTSRGLTECYRQAVQNYLADSTNPRFYCMLLNSLHHYMRMSTIYTDISYTECIRIYASLFVPQMYATSLTTDQRVNLLSMILKNTVHALAGEIVQEHIGCIIDDHTDATNIEILQDVVLKVLINQRDLSYDRFIQAQKKASKETERTKQSKELKDRAHGSIQPLETHTIEKLNTALKKFVVVTRMLKKKNAELVAKNRALALQFNELKTLFLNQIPIQKDQTKIIIELKEQLQHALQASNKPSFTITPSKVWEDTESKGDESDDDELFSVQYVEE